MTPDKKKKAPAAGFSAAGVFGISDAISSLFQGGRVAASALLLRFIAPVCGGDFAEGKDLFRLIGREEKFVLFAVPFRRQRRAKVSFFLFFGLLGQRDAAQTAYLFRLIGGEQPLVLKIPAIKTNNKKINNKGGKYMTPRAETKPHGGEEKKQKGRKKG